MYTAVDVQGFAGGFTLGMAQAGFELVGKREMKGGFGVANCEANRHLLGENWKTESCDPADWTRVDADVVFGNPPCSAWSVMSTKEFRGAESPILHCTQAFVDYAARVMPQVAVFESVQQARTKPDGLEFMRKLRVDMEEKTGVKWTLYHVRHNAYSVGGCAQRRRYFWVVSRIPFGIEIPKYDRYPTLNDAIADLSSLESTWSAQPYQTDGGWWSEPRRSSTGLVDGHSWIDNPLTKRIRDLLAGTEWLQRDDVAKVARRHYEQHGHLPESWRYSEEKLVKQNFFMGFTTPVRWPGDEPARVITGGGLVMVVHPTEPRTITHRETARILGFPDDWKIEPLRGVSGLNMTWGKGITVDCGRWIGEWISAALDGNPGTHTGELLGEDEYDIDVTNVWKTSWYSGHRPQLTRKGSNMSETPEAEVTTKSGAGRPRPEVTLERDERVYELLTGAMTRVEVGTAIEGTPAEAYLSLHRLRIAGRVNSERRDGKFVWFRTESVAAESVAAEPVAA